MSKKASKDQARWVLAGVNACMHIRKGLDDLTVMPIIKLLVYSFQKYIALWVFNGEEGYYSLCTLGFGSCTYVHAHKHF